jgi:hypothetical protein
MNTITQRNHINFGGIISTDDFSTNEPNKKRIKRYADADSFQSVLEEQKKKKQMEDNYKTMTFEELKELKIISNTNGRPEPTLTDKKWQQEFNARKMFVTPYPPNIKRMNAKYSVEYGSLSEETTYHGKTNWQEYCSFINDVLRVIESGQIDYVYYIYQILDLLKFHYNDLNTKYCDGYWEVELKKKKEKSLI